MNQENLTPSEGSKVDSRSIDDCRKNIQDFADRFKLIFDDNGQCGFGRECVGLSIANNYVCYNPYNYKTTEDIIEFYDERLFEIVPPNAYSKHSCLAVLGTGEDSIRQLSEWVDNLNELGVTVERYENGATGMQAVLSGTHGYAIRIPKGQ